MAKVGLDDFFARGHSLADAERLIVDILPDAEPAWETPIPLDVPTGPPFPLEALPGTIGEYATAVAEETQTALDMAATVALGTISAAAGGKYEVVIAEQGWNEPVHIMAVTVAEPGNRKSAVIRLITKPVVDHERDVQPGERQALAQWESRLRVLDKHLASTENKASKEASAGLASTDADRMAAVHELEAHQSVRPRITRIIVDDATPEAVTSHMAEQGGHIAAVSAESAILSNTAGSRYSDAPKLDPLLYGHAGDRLAVDRKGRASETIERACLTLNIMVQPPVIRELGASPGFVVRGGAARLLPSFPPDLLGRRRIDVQPVPADLSEAWAEIITRIVKRKPAIIHGSYAPWPLSLAQDARTRFREYRHWHEPQMARGGAYGNIRDWAGKQCGAVLRIAGLLHVAQTETPEAIPISMDTLERAITIVGYYAEHARIMYRLMGDRSDHEQARAVLDAICSVESPITRRDLRRKLRGRRAFQRLDALDGPLGVLEDYGWIHRERVTGAKGGRPSERIHLNPMATMDKTATTSSVPDASEGFGGFDHGSPVASPKPLVLVVEAVEQKDADSGAEWSMTI